MAPDPVQLGDDTAANCWLCDRARGELCHVHERREERDDTEPVPWTVPIEDGAL
jgi:hypothetical protein